MDTLTSTLADLTAAKLTAYYAPPPPGVPTMAPSTDPSVYMGDPNYLKQLNAQFLQKYAVDVPNINTANRYDYACKQWEQNGKSAALPTPPAYCVFEQKAFDQWWATYTSNLAQNAPPLFFIKPATLPPAPVIVEQGAPPPPPATDGPIGAPVPGNPGVFNPSAADVFPDGWVYVGPAGVFQKHVYANPFTANHTRVIWIALQPAPAFA